MNEAITWLWAATAKSIDMAARGCETCITNLSISIVESPSMLHPIPRERKHWNVKLNNPPTTADLWYILCTVQFYYSSNCKWGGLQRKIAVRANFWIKNPYCRCWNNEMHYFDSTENKKSPIFQYNTKIYVLTQP